MFLKTYFQIKSDRYILKKEVFLGITNLKKQS
jgi:hypothetical protein